MAAVALLALASASGCAVQSEMTNVWRDPTMTAGSVHNVLVVAIRKDPVRRRNWEDAFVEELALRGVSATPSYRRFAGALPDTDQVLEAVRKDGFDAVLTSSRLPDEATSHFVPGQVREEQVYSPDYYGYRRFHSYWVSVQDPGYTETDTIIQLRTDLWSTARDGGHLVWSGTLRALESVTGRTVKKSVTDEIVPQMEKQGAIPRRLK
jgi:hypothetical protein